MTMKTKTITTIKTKDDGTHRRSPVIFCPIHPDTGLHRLKYQKASGKPTKSGKRGTEWVTTDWHYCTECESPVKVKIQVTIESPLSAASKNKRR